MSKPKHEKEDTRQLNTYVPVKLAEALKAKAAEGGTTTRAVLIAALKAALPVSRSDDDDESEL